MTECRGCTTILTSQRVWCSGACRSIWNYHVHHAGPRSTCRVCGITILGNRNGKYCSPEHKALATYSPHQPRSKDCVVCGTTFQAWRRSLTCNPACALQRKRATARTKEKERSGSLRHRSTCVVCNQEFMSAWYGTRYCSDQCRQLQTMQRYIGKACPLRYKTCAWCQQTFLRGGYRYCSELCAANAKLVMDRAHHPPKGPTTQPCRYCATPVDLPRRLAPSQVVCDTCHQIRQSHHLRDLLQEGMPTEYIKTVHEYRKMTKEMSDRYGNRQGAKDRSLQPR